MNSALHGAENDSVIIKEFVRELTRVVDRAGRKPAILVTHHARKAGDELPAGCEIEVTDDAELRWASRGGLKLEGVLREAGLSDAEIANLAHFIANLE